MPFWFFNDLRRLASERQAIADLQDEAEWLVGHSWELQRGIQLNATIRVGDTEFEMTLEYPNHFPFAPPIARPSVAGERWSSHQYPSGTLCLEWGPDNWDQSVTGADMVRSAHRLLDTERPDKSTRTTVALSRHELTPGQELRGQYLRLCTTYSLRSYCCDLDVGEFGTLTLEAILNRDSSSMIPIRLEHDASDVWKDPEIPSGMDGMMLRGVFCKMDRIPFDSDDSVSQSAMDELLGEAGCYVEELLSDEAPPFVVLLVDKRGDIHPFWTGSGVDASFSRVKTVAFETTLENPRSPVSVHQLDQKRIGIVGLGSIGSKIAVSLARIGFHDFVLVDPEILRADNLVRHQLDWNNVGDHKVDALASTLERIVPGIKLVRSKLHLTGQESNSALNGILQTLKGCDVIVDATADDSVFNLLSGVCSLDKKPLVWGHVFEGGIGGLVARSRAGKDPSPLVMRQLFLSYCSENPFPQHEHSAPYTGVIGGQVMVATDADVSVIAGHMTSLIVDTALEDEPSRYPNSLYLVGLSRWGVTDVPPVPFGELRNLGKQKAANLP